MCKSNVSLARALLNASVEISPSGIRSQPPDARLLPHLTRESRRNGRDCASDGISYVNEVAIAAAIGPRFPINVDAISIVRSLATGNWSTHRTFPVTHSASEEDCTNRAGNEPAITRIRGKRRGPRRTRRPRCCFQINIILSRDRETAGAQASPVRV